MSKGLSDITYGDHLYWYTYAPKYNLTIKLYYLNIESHKLNPIERPGVHIVSMSS